MLKLLVAVDGSESSDKAVKEVFRQIDGSEKIFLVTVIKEMNVPGENTSNNTTTKTMKNQTTGSPASQRKIKKVREKHRIEKEGNNILKQAEQLLQEKEVDLEKYLLEGDPSDQICQLADEKDIDYIILGNRGTGGIKKFLLGSTSEKVLRNAERSVCIIK